MKKEYLAQIMAAIAFETGLHVKDGKYYDEDGNQWVIGKHGFIPVIQHNLEIENKKLATELEDLRILYKDLKSRYSITVLHERVVDSKSFAKIARILISRVDDSEKVKELKKYLNI